MKLGSGMLETAAEAILGLRLKITVTTYFMYMSVELITASR